MSYKILFIFLFAVITLSVFSQEKNSPDSAYSIHINAHHNAKMRAIEYTMFLVNNKKGDSTQLAVNRRHDHPRPTFFWSKDGKYLLFEESNVSDSKTGMTEGKNFLCNSKIKIWNLQKKKIEKILTGHILNYNRYSKYHYDRENNVIFFFRTPCADVEKTLLLMYDLNTHKEKLLKDLNCFIKFKMPTLDVTPTKRELRVYFKCLDSKTNSYDEYTYDLKY
ncbi:MAG: hypothetical protein IH946_10390 [Bacteroidetes bacterium]|nr:hypothetical protein [Bacteroidota bacterium]